MLLCLSILTLLIGMRDGKQFPKLQSEKRFGWGLSYNYKERGSGEWCLVRYCPEVRYQVKYNITWTSIMLLLD